MYTLTTAASLCTHLRTRVLRLQVSSTYFKSEKYPSYSTIVASPLNLVYVTAYDNKLIKKLAEFQEIQDLNDSSVLSQLFYTRSNKSRLSTDISFKCFFFILIWQD